MQIMTEKVVWKKDYSKITLSNLWVIKVTKPKLAALGSSCRSPINYPCGKSLNFSESQIPHQLNNRVLYFLIVLFYDFSKNSPNA